MLTTHLNAVLYTLLHSHDGLYSDLPALYLTLLYSFLPERVRRGAKRRASRLKSPDARERVPTIAGAPARSNHFQGAALSLNPVVVTKMEFN